MHDDEASGALAQHLARTALGDRAAFRHVFEATHRHLLGVAMQVLRRQDLAEEVLQEVFVSVWQRAQTYRADAGRPMTWLIAMVRHRAIDLRRSRSGSEIEAQTEAMQAAAHDVLDSSMACTDALDNALDHHRIAPCMGELAAGARQSLALAYYEGLSQSEVADHLAVPLGTVKTWLRRGLEQLRRCLDRGAPA
jgi:RNA polymerase sigma-70 factor (ECF subfamily)